MQLRTEEVRAFFDRLAPTWDRDRGTEDAVIEEILDRAGIAPGCRVLDVACGTGVLFPYYLARNVAELTGVDLSEEMIRVAGEKHRDSRLTLVAGDVEQIPLGEYDRIVVCNAFPHFPDPQGLIGRLAAHLVPGGRLTVAHDRSRHSINGHHQQTASLVSLGLPPRHTCGGVVFPLPGGGYGGGRCVSLYCVWCKGGKVTL